MKNFQDFSFSLSANKGSPKVGHASPLEPFCFQIVGEMHH